MAESKNSSRTDNSPSTRSTERAAEGTEQHVGTNVATGEIPLGVWSVLQAPFDASDVVFREIKSDDKGRGVCRPKLRDGALVSRLNRALGPEAWSLEFSCEESRVYRCRLHIGNSFRDGIARNDEPIRACMDALLIAMYAYGIGVGLHGPIDLFIEREVDTRVKNTDELLADLRDMGTIR